MKRKDIIKNLKLEVAQVKARCADRRNFLKHFKQQLDALEKEGIDGAFCGDFFDFDYLKRDTISKVLLTLPGSWSKQYDENGDGNKILHYILKPEGFTHKFRVYNAELPPSCKMVPYEVEVPASPARKQIKYKIDCGVTA